MSRDRSCSCLHLGGVPGPPGPCGTSLPLVGAGDGQVWAVSARGAGGLPAPRLGQLSAEPGAGSRNNLIRDYARAN